MLQALREKTNVEKEIVELNQTIALREQELDEHEMELASLRTELQGFYEKTVRDHRPPPTTHYSPFTTHHPCLTTRDKSRLAATRPTWPRRPGSAASRPTS